MLSVSFNQVGALSNLLPHFLRRPSARSDASAPASAFPSSAALQYAQGIAAPSVIATAQLLRAGQHLCCTGHNIRDPHIQPRAAQMHLHIQHRRYTVSTIRSQCLRIRRCSRVCAPSDGTTIRSCCVRHALRTRRTVQMLFCTSLVAYVGAGLQPALTPRKLTLLNTATSEAIQDISFPSVVLAVLMNRSRCDQAETHTHTHAHTRAHTHTHTQSHLHTHVYTDTYTHTQQKTCVSPG